MEHALCWLWLATKKNIASAKIAALLERFETVEGIYEAKSFNNIPGISDREKSELMNKDLSLAKSIAEKVLKIGGKILVFDDENYPQILKNISDPPYVLYIQGKVPELDKVLTIGVVGTRHCSEYGRIVTERICTSLAKEGAVTISGLALGIDSAGAWATIDAGGIAVGVTGCGLDRVYPQENARLIQEMTEKGCILTEFPPGTPPLKCNFPRRNRIIAGLSRGVLVTEAPQRSGALITARYALENNRDVFAVPRNITDIKYLGTNIIIREGAKLVNSIEDIICEYPYAEKVTANAKQKKTDILPDIKPDIDNNKYKNLNENEKTIINILTRKNMQIDELSRELDIPVSEINTRLIMLEVKGLVKKLPGSAYQLKL